MTNNTFNINDLQKELTTKSREIWLAGLGALATAQEESTKLYNTLSHTGREIMDQANALQRRVMNLPEEAQDLLKEGESYAENLMDKGEDVEQNLIKQAKKIEKKSTTEINRFVDDLKEKGNEWQEAINKTVSNPLEKVAEKVGTPVQAGVSNMMDYFGIPTHTEIKALNQKVETLTHKVEELAKLLVHQEKEAVKTPKAPKTAAPKAEKANA